MKTNRFFIILFILTCIGYTSAKAMEHKRIKGNGKVKIEARQMRPFEQIIVHGSMDVVVQQSPSAHSLTIEAESNIIPYIDTSVHDGTLTIRYKSALSISTKKRILIKVKAPNIMTAELRGSGDLTFAQGFRQESLRVNLSGSGDIRFSDTRIYGDAMISAHGSGDINGQLSIGNNAHLSISGSGDMNLSLGNPRTIKTTLKGSGDIVLSFKSANEVCAILYGSGDITMKGKANKTRLQAKGSGDIHGQKLITHTASVEMSGSADGTLSVTDLLAIKLFGSTDFVCYGRPKITDYQVSRSSSFRTK